MKITPVKDPPKSYNEKYTRKGRQGIVVQNPHEGQGSQRARINQSMADYFPGVIVSSHAYWGDPDVLEDAPANAHRGNWGGGHPDYGYSDELIPFVNIEGGRARKDADLPPFATIMDVMKSAVDLARDKGYKTVLGAYCDQTGCHSDKPYMSRTSKLDRYQNIVDTSDVDEEFELIAPTHRTTAITASNPFGSNYGIALYRRNRPPVIVKKDKPVSVLDLIDEARALAAESDKEKFPLTPLEQAQRLK